MSEVIRDEAALWHESRQAEIQDYEEPAFIEPEPKPEQEDSKEHITYRDVKTELNMLKLNEPTAEIIVGLIDVILPIVISIILNNTEKEDIKLDDDERETLTSAWAQYLKTTSINLTPGWVLIVTMLTIYGAKVSIALVNRKKEPEFIETKQKEENNLHEKKN